MRGVLRDPSLDAAFKELVLTLPSEGYVAEQLDASDPLRIHAAREALKRQLATALRDDWAWAFETHQVVGPYSADPVSSGRRSLANLALSMLCLDASARADAVWPGRAYQRFKDAVHMTDAQGALAALIGAHSELAEPALERFYERYRDHPLVIDKWFSFQATAPERNGQVFERVKALLRHPAFTLSNPNRARSLVGAFCMSNPAAFHRPDAGGYQFWADRVLELDARQSADGGAHRARDGPLDQAGRAVSRRRARRDQPGRRAPRPVERRARDRDARLARLLNFKEMIE